MELRILARDAAARLSRYELPSGRRLILPTFFPVYNPNIPVITPKELEDKFNWDCLITNAYIYWRKRKKGDIHRMLDFDGIVMMDSGAYQIWMYGDIEATNEEIVEYQNALKPDIGTFLDVIVPYTASKIEAERAVKETVTAARIAKEIGDKSITWVGTAQGSTYLDLVRKNAKEIVNLDFEYYAVGTLKIATNEWLFLPQVDYVMSALSTFPKNRPVHFWGLGHPATFGLFVMLGIDSFDSASYALYAKDDRYMTPSGTLRLEEMKEFPCNCPVCSSYTPEEVRSMEKGKRTKVLAEHNLYVILAEIRRIREAIRGEYLFEYVQEKTRAHPRLFEAFLYALKKYGKHFLENTPFPKKRGLFIAGEEGALRPEIVRAKKMLKRVKKDGCRKRVLGVFPCSLAYTYPFGQSHIPFQEDVTREVDPVEAVRMIIMYQWGVDIGKRLRVEVRNGRPRRVYAENAYIGMIRPSDGFFIPSIEGARILAKKISGLEHKVIVTKEAVEPVSKGRSVFCKFVRACDPDLHPNEEVIVLSQEGEVIATGKAVLSAREVKEFRHHVAVKVRHHAK